MQMAPGSPAAEGGAPLRGILGGWRTELTGAASVFQLPKMPHTQRQSNPLLQAGADQGKNSWYKGAGCSHRNTEQQPAVGSCIEKGQTGTELCQRKCSQHSREVDIPLY